MPGAVVPPHPPLHAIDITILCFMSNFSFKGGILFRRIPFGGIHLFVPPDSLMGGYNITGHRLQRAGLRLNCALFVYDDQFLEHKK